MMQRFTECGQDKTKLKHLENVCVMSDVCGEYFHFCFCFLFVLFLFCFCHSSVYPASHSTFVLL